MFVICVVLAVVSADMAGWFHNTLVTNRAPHVEQRMHQQQQYPEDESEDIFVELNLPHQRQEEPPGDTSSVN